MITRTKASSLRERITRVTKNRGFTVLFAVLSLLAWITVWHALAAKMDKPLLLPYPYDVLCRFLALTKSALFWRCTAYSMLSVLLGLLYAILLGIVFSALTARFPLLRTLLSPLLSVIRSTPVAAFIVLLLLWVGRDETPIVITMLVALPPVWKNLEAGLLSVDPALAEMSRALGLPLWKRILYLWIPSVLPHFRSAVQTAVGMGWKAGIAAEILALPTLSIGREIYNANLLLETTDLFAWTLAVVLLSLLIELCMTGLIGRLFHRKRHGADRVKGGEAE